MRVLYVNQTAQVSGAERSLLALVEGIREVVDPVAACPEGELAGALRGLGLSPTTIPGTDASFRLHPRHTSRALLEIACSSLALRRVVERLAPDVVHANTTRAAMLSLTLQGPPIVAHIRDWVPPGHASRVVLGMVGRRADAVVANSRYVAGQFEGLPLRAPVRVVHNPVDLAQFDPAAVDHGEVRRELDLDESTVVLAVVAQLTPWKGQDDAIRVLAHLAGGGRDVVLLLAGSAKFTAPGTRFDNLAYARRLRTLASELRVNERVRFLGERSDVPRVLAATDVLLLPSWREAFGRIAIEAMAMGLPVAATEVGGPSEIVRAGVDGLLLPPREPELWARGLEPLVDDAGRRRQMGENGRRKALRSFSVDAHTAALLAVYDDLAHRRVGERREPGRRSTSQPPSGAVASTDRDVEPMGDSSSPLHTLVDRQQLNGPPTAGRSLAQNVLLPDDCRGRFRPRRSNVLNRMTTSNNSHELELQPGELVRVRPAQEIFKTLDHRGTLDNLPFMPEMVQYCGRTFSVSKRADKTCGPDHGLRRMDHTVHLSNVRCDGMAHGGCQAACLLWWKEAWLERVTAQAVPQSQKLGPDEQAFVSETLLQATTAWPPSGPDDQTWRCQATDIPQASTRLHGWHFGQYPRDVRNWGLRKVIWTMIIEAFNRWQLVSRRHLPEFLLFRGGQTYPFIAGPLEKGKTPAATLDLQPGDVVRIKSKAEIEKTLDHTNRNRGLNFDAEMVQYCGRTARVRARVRRLINEETGKMINIHTDCIILEGVTCTADYHRLCPRGIFPYWREIWLEKVG